MKNRLFWLVALMVVVFVLSRWPGLMPLSFSAAYAIAFCAGIYFPGRLGWIIPLAVFAGSDLLLKLLFYRQVALTPAAFLMQEAPVLIAYAALFGLGRLFGAKKSWWALLGGGFIGAILFYIITNTASWLSLPYPKTIAGWVQALTTGFPGYPQTWEFFRNTLLSGGLFTGLFVAAMKSTEESKEPETETEGEEGAEDEPQGKPAEAKS